MNDFVSIILPVYNGEKFLRESIDSVISQTWKNWELLIVDDCSTDSSPVIAKEYVAKDDRIHYYRNEENLRLPRNLNRGFSLAKGDFLTWTSDDNMYEPEAIERMVEKLKEDNDAEFVFASCRIIDEEGNPIEYIMVNENSPKMLIGHNSVGACFMYTRKVYEEVGEYDPTYTLVEDYDYWQRISAKFKTVIIEEILYKYRFHDGALTSTMKKDIFNQTLEKMLLKNREAFGKVDSESKYYYYKGLWKCRENVNGLHNPYQRKYIFYKIIFWLEHKIPNKLRRIIKGK